MILESFKLSKLFQQPLLLSVIPKQIATLAVATERKKCVTIKKSTVKRWIPAKTLQITAGNLSQDLRSTRLSNVQTDSHSRTGE